MSNQQATELITFAALLEDKREIQSAGLFASAAFEAILPDVFVKSGESQYDKRIDEYCFNYKCNDDVRKSLKKAKIIRNKIIHGHHYAEVNDLIDCLCFSLGLDKKETVANSDQEDFRRMRKEFSESEVNPTLVSLGGMFKGFSEVAFRNLDDLHFGLRLLKARLTPFCQKLTPPLAFDEISEPNSAYVWLAAVNELEGRRSKIDKPSISVLLTNQDLRVYLDFGGRCKEPRKKYYKNLLDKDYDQTLKGLNEHYRIFDVYWYFNLENVLTIQEFVEKRDMGGLIDQKTLITEVEDFIGFIDENRTIPENKLLIGRIFTKDQVVELGEEIAEVIQNTYEDLHKIYSDLT